MKAPTLAIAAAFAFVPFLAPLCAGAEAADRSYVFHTRMVEQSPTVGEFDGSLKLRISADGIVSGFYRPDSDARFISVTGGLTGDRLWFDIGTFSTRPLRFSGTLRNGTIDADSDRPFLDGSRYTGLTLIGTFKAN